MVSAIIINALRIAAFIGMGTLLILSGLYYFRRAQELADIWAAEVAAHPWQRFGLPARWYSSKKFFWQLRISAVGAIAIGVILIASPLIALIQHL